MCCVDTHCIHSDCASGVTLILFLLWFTSLNFTFFLSFSPHPPTPTPCPFYFLSPHLSLSLSLLSSPHHPPILSLLVP